MDSMVAVSGVVEMEIFYPVASHPLSAEVMVIKVGVGIVVRMR